MTEVSFRMHHLTIDLLKLRKVLFQKELFLDLVKHMVGALYVA